MKWQKVKLGDVCNIHDSKRIPVSAKERTKGSYPYYGANGVQDFVNDYIFDGEFVLIAEDGGNFGSKTKPISYRVSGKFWANNHAHVLSVKDNLDVDYLCYSTMFYDVTKFVNCATRQKLTQEALRNIEIPLPPREEQDRIAKELDAVSDLLAKQKQLLTEQDTLIKSVFYDMFGKYFEIGNAYKLLPDICKFIDYRGKTPEKVDSGILLITAKNVRPNLFQSEPQEYISEDTYDARMTRGFPQINDVMFTTEAPLGYVCRIPRLNGKFSVGQRIIVMHPYSEITSEYLEYALSSDSFQSEMYKHSSGSTARLMFCNSPRMSDALRNKRTKMVKLQD